MLHIFFARGLQAGERQLDADEFLDVIELTVPEVLEGIRTGRITDAKTLSCSVWLQNVASGAWALDWQTGSQAGS